MPFIEDLNFNREHTRPLPLGQLEVDKNESNAEQIFPDLSIPTDKIGGLDGLEATVAELNVLSGITATTDELNYTDGVTSNIQTQLDGKIGPGAVFGDGSDGDVTIGGTSTYNAPTGTSGAGYAGVSMTQNTIATVRATAGISSGTTFVLVKLESGSTSNNWTNIQRGLLNFDTSAIPDTATITSATLTLTPSQINLAFNQDICIATRTAYGVIADSDFNIGNWTMTDQATRIAASALVEETPVVFTLNATGIASINKTGSTIFGVCGSNDMDSVSNNWASLQVFQTLFYTSGAGAGLEPLLTVVYSDNITLTKDTFYKDLTVPAGAILNTAGYKLFFHSATIAGTIRNNGTAGGNGGDGNGNGGATPSGGAAGSGGAGGTLLAGTNGKAGGAAGAQGGGALSNGVAGTTGESITVALGVNGVAGAGGGTGGNGWDSGGTGGSAGAAGTKTSPISYPRTAILATNFWEIVGSTITGYKSSAGSGSSGGGGGGANDQFNTENAGTGGGGGGSGGGGGTVLIFGKTITISATGVIQANGGNGGNGGAGGSPTGGIQACGGGGGGGAGSGGSGGIVFLVYNSLTNAGAIEALGGSAGTVGAAGTGKNGGTNGTAGSAGTAGLSGTIYSIQL